MMDLICSSLVDSIHTKQSILDSPALLDAIESVAQQTIDTLNAGGKVLLCGNGGSASDAQHLTGEFVSRFRFDRPALAAVALNCNATILTAIGNDYAYELIFKRQVEALGKPGDILWGFSTTGNSKNVSLALKAAKAAGIKTVGFLGGSGGCCLEDCDTALLVPSADPPRVQECHITMGHIICDCVEQAMFAKP